jgi:hypothetical protein
MSKRLANSACALVFLSGIAMSGTPAFAVEPDVDSPAGPELPAPRSDQPDFQQDDQTGAVVDPKTEGAEPGVAPDIVIVAPD